MIKGVYEKCARYGVNSADMYNAWWWWLPTIIAI